MEFAIGTGRVGVALAARGVPVAGIELSEPMVAQLRRKVDEGTAARRVGDMATTVVARGRGLFARLPGLEQHLESPKYAGRTGAVLPKRSPPPQARWSLRDRAVGATDPAPRSRTRGSSDEPRRGAPRLRHLRPGHPAMRVPPLPPRSRRQHPLRGRTLSLHLALGMRSHGAAGRTRARVTVGRLEPQAPSSQQATVTCRSGARSKSVRPPVRSPRLTCSIPWRIPASNSARPMSSMSAGQYGSNWRSAATINLASATVNSTAMRSVDPSVMSTRYPRQYRRPPIGAKAALSTEQVTPTKHGARGVY